MMSCSAIVLFLLSRRIDKTVPIARRFDRKLEQARRKQLKTNFFSPTRWGMQMAQRAGFTPRPNHLWLFSVFFIFFCSFAFYFRGGIGLLTAIISTIAGLYLFALWRSAATQRTLLQQLPIFIDQIIRSMGIGRSFESSLLQAIENSPPPLSKALENVVIDNSLGGDLVESLTDSAELYRIHELHIITLALKINRRYGGSIKSMLESIITLIRQKEQAQRELKALTGETRLTAWLLGSMPIALAGYMMIQNPQYVGYLLEAPNGYAIIYTALGLQTVGGLILWRMLRSIQ